MADLAKIQRAIANAKANGDLAAASRMEAYLSQLQSNPPPGVVGRDWDTVASQAAKNFGPSLYNYGSDIVTAVTNPIDTIGTLGDLGAGALREGAKAVLPSPVFDTLDSIGNQQAGKRASAVANAVGGHYKGRYGSWEGFKQGIAEDPVGVMSDLSLPVTGAGGLVARTGGVTGKIGRFAQVAGDMLDPVSAAIRSGRAGGRAVSSIAGYASGMGDEPARSIFNARRAGGPQAEAANRGMRSPPRDELADEAFAKMDVRRRQAQADYQNEIAATHGSNARINWNNIFRSIHDTLRSNMTVRGNRFYGGPSGRKMMQDVLSTVQEYVADPALHNLEGLDALKKELSLLQEPIGAQPAKGAENSNRLVSEVIDGVKDEIIRLEPSYATASENYQVWKELQGELRKALSLNDKAAADTVMRKLQSTMRNNVQTNYGSRTQLLDELDSVSAPSRPGRPELHAGTLRAELAGQAANTWMPRGIARSGGAFAIPAGIAAASGVLVNNPGYAALAAPFIPMASPRLVGEVAGLLGSGARVVDDAAAASPEIARAARAATGRAGRQVNRQIGQAVNESEGVVQDANGVWYDINGNIVQ